MTVLSKEFVEDAVKILVTRFIPLNPSDLEGWMEDPEEWVNAEEKENDQWEYELRVYMRSRDVSMKYLLIPCIAVRRTCSHDTCYSIPSIRAPSD